MKPQHLERRPCPEPDLLVGWAEGNLADSEARAIEAHLARCWACREEVAELDERAAHVPLPDFLESSGRGGAAVRPKLLRFAVVLAAAALLVYAGVRSRTTPADSVTVEVALADARADLFAPSRTSDAAESPQWFLGVRVDRPSHVAVVAVDSTGAARPVPLDRTGALSLAAQPGVDLAVGPYPRVLDAATDLRVSAVLLIAAQDPLPADWTERWLEPAVGGAREFLRALEERGAPSVVLREL